VPQQFCWEDVLKSASVNVRHFCFEGTSITRGPQKKNVTLTK
jgi:hypothetical protein